MWGKGRRRHTMPHHATPLATHNLPVCHRRAHLSQRFLTVVRYTHLAADAETFTRTHRCALSHTDTPPPHTHTHPHLQLAAKLLAGVVIIRTAAVAAAVVEGKVG